jgi:hypothetical protein
VPRPPSTCPTGSNRIAVPAGGSTPPATGAAGRRARQVLRWWRPRDPTQHWRA